MFGELGAGFRADNVTVGPVTFVGTGGYEGQPLRFFVTRTGLFLPQKILVVVERGAPVRVSVAPQDRPFASLLYDPALFNRRYAGAGAADHTVIFEPCGASQARTQFNGAFVVDAPRCVTLLVQREGAAVERGVARFATPDCTR